MVGIQTVIRTVPVIDIPYRGISYLPEQKQLDSVMRRLGGNGINTKHLLIRNTGYYSQDDSETQKYVEMIANDTEFPERD